jgi:hypothetical protein
VRRPRPLEIPAVRNALGLHSPSRLGYCVCRVCMPGATWRDRTPAGQRRAREAFASRLSAAFIDGISAVWPDIVRAAEALAAEVDAARADPRVSIGWEARDLIALAEHDQALLDRIDEKQEPV